MHFNNLCTVDFDKYQSVKPLSPEAAYVIDYLQLTTFSCSVFFCLPQQFSIINSFNSS